jgi:hypothetical protein
VGAVDEGLGQIDLAANAQVLCQRLQDLPEDTVGHPLLHSAMTGLVRRVFARQRLPGCSGPEDPQHAVENAARFDAWATLAVLANSGLGDQRLDNTPLLVSELHVLLDHIRDPNAILCDHVLRNRSNFDYLPMSILRCVLGQRLRERDEASFARDAGDLLVERTRADPRDLAL